MYKHGWYQVAFEQDNGQDLTPVAVGATRLMLVRAAGGLRAFSADCPHRGAHLALGGKLCEGHVVCPFHGYEIGLGKESKQGFQVREYPTLMMGGMVFVRLSLTHENGLTTLLKELSANHNFVPGFEMNVRTSMEVVIENGFDQRHFVAVHGIGTDQFLVHKGQAGDLIVRSNFRTGGRDQGRLPMVPYIANTISPGLIIVQLKGNNPYTIITGATNRPDGGCVIRLTLVLLKSLYGTPPHEEFCRSLLTHSRRGLEEDRRMWENLSLTSPQLLTSQDAPVLEFQKFCEGFR